MWGIYTFGFLGLPFPKERYLKQCPTLRAEQNTYLFLKVA
jgi:hypothetical protein